eukprot:IDg13900t1
MCVHCFQAVPRAPILFSIEFYCRNLVPVGIINVWRPISTARSGSHFVSADVDKYHSGIPRTVETMLSEVTEQDLRRQNIPAVRVPTVSLPNGGVARLMHL